MKRKKNAGRRFLGTVDLNTITGHFKTDVRVFIPRWLPGALERRQEPPQRDPGGRHVDGEPPGGEC